MKLRIPPPIVTLIFGAAIYLVAKFLPIGHFDFFGRSFLIYVLFAIAIILASAGILQFRKFNTTTNPMKPSKASSLITDGIYNYSRNPMYLALLLLLLAEGLWFGNAFNTLTVAGFVAYMNNFQILLEEKALASKFGKSYHQYCILVRRWF